MNPKIIEALGEGVFIRKEGSHFVGECWADQDRCCFIPILIHQLCHHPFADRLNILSKKTGSSVVENNKCYLIGVYNRFPRKKK